MEEKTFNEKRQAVLDALAGNEEVLAFAEEVLKKAKKGSGIKKESQAQIFRQTLLDAGEKGLTEDEMWLKFRAGRHEAMTLCRGLHERVPQGQEVIWAQDVEEDGVTYYRIIGFGEEMPDDYKIRRKGKKAKKEVAEPEEDFSSEIENGLDIH